MVINYLQSIEEVEEEPKRLNIREKLHKFFYKEKIPKEPVYKRRLWDGRIERYLDENFDDYIIEYKLVTKTDLESYETKEIKIKERLKDIDTFILDTDATITTLERRVKNVKNKITKEE